MTSQVLAIYFLNDLDHFIKEQLNIKYYVRYQDDGCLYHPSKEYLKHCLNEISAFLKNENLQLNRKTRIYKCNNNFIFLGRDSHGRYGKYRYVNRRLKNKFKRYKNKSVKLNSLIGSIQSYNYLVRKIKNC